MPASATIASAVSAGPFYLNWTFWSFAVALVALAFCAFTWAAHAGLQNRLL